MRVPTNAAGQHAPASPGRRGRLTTQARRLAATAQRHWLLTVLLAAGLVLRILTQIAYRPAVLYIDSIKYLLGAYPGNDPPGYELLLKPLVAVGNLDLVAAAQHLLGLAMAVVIYLLLRRRGAPRWLSALATAPILLDAYQLQIEQTMMPDVMFEALIVAGLAALTWRSRPTTAMAVTGGLALGASATVAQVGEILIVPALVYLVVTLPRWRLRLKQAVVLCAAFAFPILAASYKNYVTPSVHRFALAPYAANTIYGRMAEAADCATLKLPPYERPLCPSPKQKLLGPDGLDHLAGSPIKTFQAPPGVHGAVTNFAFQVVRQQPLRVLSAIGSDALKLFAVVRVTSPGDTPISRWQFQASFPQYPPYVTVRNGEINFVRLNHAGQEQFLGTSERFGGGGPTVVKPLASFLRAYQLDGGYTPGPLLAFAVLAGLAGSLSLLRRRATPAQRDAARACLLTFTSAAAILLVSDAFEFSWRYQLPALVTLPPAAALGITALAGRRRARDRQVPGPEGLPRDRQVPGPEGLPRDRQVPGARRGPATSQDRSRAPASDRTPAN